MSVSFSGRPDFNQLYLDYIHNFDKVSKFFAFNYRSTDDFLKCIDAKKNSYLKNAPFDRISLAEVLREQNKAFDSSDKSFDNIELLEEENTFAVVTGQQVGMLTGALYTIYKALNTIHLAAKLSEKFQQYKFVPVFWLEAEDHDFLEINNLTVLDNKNEPASISYFTGGEEKEKYLTPVGKIILDEHIKEFSEELRNTLQDTDFSGNLFEYVDSSYSPGTDMKTAFAKFLNSIFRESGLIFCDPSDVRIKKFCTPVFEKELETFPQVCETVVSKTAEIEQDYEPQVKPRAINLFFINNENRYALEPRDNGEFALKNSRQKFERDELFEILRTSPQNFSTNVITRPIMQDYLLPTVAYVGGPSEISYFAQFKEVYELFDIQMPVIYPRSTVTLLEKKVINFLGKYEIDFMELLDERKLSGKFLQQSEDFNIDDLFTRYLDELNSLNYGFGNELAKIDKNLVNTFKNKSQKNIESIEVLKQKFVDSHIRQNETTLKKMKSVIRSIYPDSTLQERVFNISYFLNKYSMDFIEFLFNKINIEDFNHQLIEIDPESGDELFEQTSS